MSLCMSFYVNLCVITMESVGGSVAKHSNLMKKVKCCHFNLHSVYHVVKILVQVEPGWRKSSGVEVGKDQIQRIENFL